MNVYVLTSDKYFHLELELDGLRRFGLEPEKILNLGKLFELMLLILSYALNHLIYFRFSAISECSACDTKNASSNLHLSHPTIMQRVAGLRQMDILKIFPS